MATTVEGTAERAHANHAFRWCADALFKSGGLHPILPQVQTKETERWCRTKHTRCRCEKQVPDAYPRLADA